MLLQAESNDPNLLEAAFQVCVSRLMTAFGSWELERKRTRGKNLPFSLLYTFPSKGLVFPIKPFLDCAVSQAATWVCRAYKGACRASLWNAENVAGKNSTQAEQFWKGCVKDYLLVLSSLGEPGQVAIVFNTSGHFCISIFFYFCNI